MKTIAITIDEDTLSKVDALVAGSDRMASRSAAIRIAIRELADREERRQAEARERDIVRKHRRRLAREARALVRHQAHA